MEVRALAPAAHALARSAMCACHLLRMRSHDLQYEHAVARLWPMATPRDSASLLCTASLSALTDSTARQQTVSLCCLLLAGTAAAGGGFHVTITKAVPFMDFRCRVTAPGGRPVAIVSFARFMRANSLPTWRPVERHPRLAPTLAAAIARAPTLLIINLGAWEFEDGCHDMHSLHDGACNATRPWILRECDAGFQPQPPDDDLRCLHASGPSHLQAQLPSRPSSRRYGAKWMLVAAAVRAVYLERSPSREDDSLVVWRAATPRDFEGGVAKSGGRCRRREPLRPSYLGSLERDLDPSTMRFAVLSKNLIMDAVAAQRGARATRRT